MNKRTNDRYTPCDDFSTSQWISTFVPYQLKYCFFITGLFRITTSQVHFYNWKHVRFKVEIKV